MPSVQQWGQPWGCSSVHRERSWTITWMISPPQWIQDNIRRNLGEDILVSRDKKRKEASLNDPCDCEWEGINIKPQMSLRAWAYTQEMVTQSCWSLLLSGCVTHMWAVRNVSLKSGKLWLNTWKGLIALFQQSIHLLIDFIHLKHRVSSCIRSFRAALK